MLSSSQAIREILQKDIDLSAKDVCERLKDKDVTPQLVYNIRAELKRKRSSVTNKSRLTRNQNKNPLGTHILDALSKNQNGLVDREIFNKVKEGGYTSASDNFFDIVRSKLYELAEKGDVIKNGITYYIKPGKNPLIVPVNEQENNNRQLIQEIEEVIANEVVVIEEEKLFDQKILVELSSLRKKIGDNGIQKYLDILKEIG